MSAETLAPADRKTDARGAEATSGLRDSVFHAIGSLLRDEGYRNGGIQAN